MKQKKIVRQIFYILLFQYLLFFSFSGPAKGQGLRSQVRKALYISKKNAILLDSINQLLVVFNKKPENNTARLVALEKKGKDWIVISTPMAVGIGRKGFASLNSKREGDKKSPTGFFRLGQLFCNDQYVNTKMPFTQITSEDKWIDDPNSDDYNLHVRGSTQAKSYENLKLSDDEYKYCMVIEYNMHPVVKGLGSAIFLHLWEKEIPNPTSGCVVLCQKDMEWILNWLNPRLKPSIIMGYEKELINGI